MKVLILFVLSSLTNISLGKTFKILSLNIHQLPPPIGMQGHKERVKQLAQKINAWGHKPDVITLQEAWTAKARDLFYQRVKDAYPYKKVDDSSGAMGGLGVASGLAIYSKFPIKESFMKHFEAALGFDRLAKKGILGVRLDVEGEEVLVFTTHLQAGVPFYLAFFETDESYECSEQQILEIRQALDGWVGEYEKVFLTGDFNVTFGTSEYEKMLGDLYPIRNTSRRVVGDPEGTVWSGDEVNEKVIDYIFEVGYLRSPGRSRIVDYFGPEVTDHLGVLGRFEI